MDYDNLPTHAQSSIEHQQETHQMIFEGDNEQGQVQSDIDINVVTNQRQQFHYNLLLIALILVLSIACFYELILMHRFNQTPNPSNYQLESIEQAEHVKQYSDSYTDDLPVLEDQQKYKVSEKVKKRVSFGQPHAVQRFLSIVTITNREKVNYKGTCGILNGVLVVTLKSVKTINHFFETGWEKLIIIVDRKDKFADEILVKYFKTSQQGSAFNYSQTDATVDSDYEFLNEKIGRCQRIIYLQNYFEIDSGDSYQLLKIANSLGDYEVKYSQSCKLKNQDQKLPNLMDSDLDSIPQQQLNQYLFMFDPRLLHVVGPLNFAFFNKYTIEEIIIYPLLALVQGSRYLSKYEKILHKIDESFVQFKQFPLRPARSQTFQNNVDFCFVSYPSQPGLTNKIQLDQYLNSIMKMELTNPLSIVIFLPYVYEQISSQLIESAIKIFEYLSQTKKQSRLNMHFKRMRLILHRNKAVSSLSNYESSYTYCPTKALIIASRHNIEFKNSFMKKIEQIYSSKSHYYHINFQKPGEGGQQATVTSTIFPNSISFPSTRYVFRNEGLYYKEYFQHVQIYKSDLIKMLYFQMLKSEELDFYETEASYVLAMLEIIRLNVGKADGIGYRVHQRYETQKEAQQFTNLKKYLQMPQMPNNILDPYPLSSLGNLAFRKNAPNKIEKNLHQVWIGEEEPSILRIRLHESLKKINQGFNIFMWKNQNITIQNFPITHSLISRSLEFQKTSNRSYLAPIVSLIRYEALLRHGGIYLDFKTEGLKPLDPFLKYEIFFTDATTTSLRFGNPNYLGNPIMGAQKNSYYLNFVLTQLILQEKVNYQEKMFPKIVGAYVLRKCFQTRQIFNTIGLGFHLFSPRPVLEQQSIPEEISLCLTVENFEGDQQIFEITDSIDKSEYKVGLPCKRYPQAYVHQYKPLGRTWVSQKN